MADELKANDKSVKEDEAETEDHGLLLADRVLLHTLSIDTSQKKLTKGSNKENERIIGLN